MASFSSIAQQLAGSLPAGAFSSQGMQEKIPSGYRKYAVQNFTPEQMDLFSQLFGLVDPDSDNYKLAEGDSSIFDDIEAPALRQFNELQGNLASRFSGMGMGARRSSGFNNASNAAAQDFASQLQSNRQSLQRQAILDLMGISSELLGQRPYTVGLSEKRQKEGGGWGASIGAGLGGLGGFFAGGLPGALQGAKLGYGVGSAF